MYAALEFERALARGADLDVTLVNRDNFFLFTPMLHEVAASDLDIRVFADHSGSCCGPILCEGLV
jgi:NADH dehydrogenase FAD-containing subunit